MGLRRDAVMDEGASVGGRMGGWEKVGSLDDMTNIHLRRVAVTLA